MQHLSLVPDAETRRRNPGYAALTIHRDADFSTIVGRRAFRLADRSVKRVAALAKAVNDGIMIWPAEGSSIEFCFCARGGGEHAAHTWRRIGAGAAVTVLCGDAVRIGRHAALVVSELEAATSFVDGGGGDSRCTICLQAIDGAEPLGRLPCAHLFHYDCIAQWAEIDTRCVLCKKNFAGIDRRDSAGGDNVTWVQVHVSPRVQRVAVDEHEDAMYAQLLQRAEDDGLFSDADDVGVYGGDASAYDNVACERCASGADDGLLLLCDACDSAHHTYCLTPRLGGVPSGTWLCPGCEHERRRAGGSVAAYIGSVRSRRAQERAQRAGGAEPARRE